MWDVALTELNMTRIEPESEKQQMPEKYHKQLNHIFKKYYHTAIRKLIMAASLAALGYLIIDDVFNFTPSKIITIMIATILTTFVATILVYPLIRIHKIKHRAYKWHIGKCTFARNHHIFIDGKESTPTNKHDKTNTDGNIYMLIWFKNKKYAINTYTKDIEELSA